LVGFDHVRAVAELGVPKAYRIEAAFAVGQLGDPSGLPQELKCATPIYRCDFAATANGDLASWHRRTENADG
jgi:hypothetical protein